MNGHNEDGRRPNGRLPDDWHDIGLLFGLTAIAEDRHCADIADDYGLAEPHGLAAVAFESGFMAAWQLEAELNTRFCEDCGGGECQLPGQ